MLEVKETGLRRHSSLPARITSPTPPTSYPPPVRRASLAGPRPAPTASSTPLDVPPRTVVPALTPAMAVRANLLQRVMLSFTGLGGDTKAALLVKGGLTLAQVIAFAVVLGVSASDTCDKPLRMYLAVHLVRSALAYPLSFYASLLPPAPRGHDAESEERRAARERNRVIGSERWDGRVKFARAPLVALTPPADLLTVQRSTSSRRPGLFHHRQHLCLDLAGALP